MSDKKVFPWWEDVITVYNKYEDPTTQIVQWTRHVLSDCFWKFAGTQISVGSVVLEGNSTICRIPEDELFKQKYEWRNLTSEDRAKYFTLGVGDIVVHGDIDEIIDEYTNGHRSSDIILKYKDLGCIVIQNVSINVGTAKCIPHYYIQGE